MSAITPPTSLVTAYKAHDSSSQRNAGSAQQGREDKFGPAVSAPPMSGATQGAIQQAALTTDPLTYDQSGKTRN